MSYPEVLRWQRLRGSPEGLRFRRQHPIGPDYVADFYCSSAKLVIEVDGQVHSTADALAHDRERDAYMLARGLTVLRVAAADVLRDADDAAQAIVTLAAAPLHQPSAGPPPRSGEDQE